GSLRGRRVLDGAPQLRLQVRGGRRRALAQAPGLAGSAHRRSGATGDRQLRGRRDRESPSRGLRVLDPRGRRSPLPRQSDRTRPGVRGEVGGLARASKPPRHALVAGVLTGPAVAGRTSKPRRPTRWADLSPPPNPRSASPPAI